MWKIILLALLVAACGENHPKLVQRIPDASDLAPCELPEIPPAKPTSNEAAKGWIRADQLLLACKAKHDGLIEFYKAGPQAP